MYVSTHREGSGRAATNNSPTTTLGCISCSVVTPIKSSQVTAATETYYIKGYYDLDLEETIKEQNLSSEE